MLNLHSPEDAVEKLYENPIDLANFLTTGRDSFIFNVNYISVRLQFCNFIKIIEASLNSFF